MTSRASQTDHHMPSSGPAKARRTHRLAALSALLGIPLLPGGILAPLIVRITHFSDTACPNCPLVSNADAFSYVRLVTEYPYTLKGEVALLVMLSPFLALIVAQAAIAWSQWRGRPSRALLTGGLLATLVAMALFLLVSFAWYCLFFCDLKHGFPIPGQPYSVTGDGSAVSGVRYLAPGFWLMLSGLLWTLLTDLTLLVSASRSLRKPV
jgi:hypothetical protein